MLASLLACLYQENYMAYGLLRVPCTSRLLSVQVCILRRCSNLCNGPISCPQAQASILRRYLSCILRRCLDLYTAQMCTMMLKSPQSDQEGNKLQRQKILSFIYPIYNHNWRNISNVYIYNKTSIKRNILTIKQNTSRSRSGQGLISTPVKQPLKTRADVLVKYETCL